jgi:hypothetical protein
MIPARKNMHEHDEQTRMKGKIPKPAAIAAICAIWAVVYLPSIGAPDFSRNECRRVLPAVTMIQTGDWKTPMLSGKPYYRKPPLINWMIATSMKTVPADITVAARLPTALAILATAICLLFAPMRLLSPESRILASAAFLTTVGLATQGRKADIDPNYVCCSVLAIALWLDGWSRDASAWRSWTLPAIPLAAGMLLKGPLILLIYYLFVFAVLAAAKNKKALLAPAHLAGIAITIIPFLIWALASHPATPPTESAESAGMGSTWIREMAYRFHFGEISFGKWAGRVAGGVAQFLPWLLILPFLWLAKNTWKNASEKENAFMTGAKTTLVAVFILINAMPATKARYSLPLLPIVILAAAFVAANTHMRGKWLNAAAKTLAWTLTAVFAADIMTATAFLAARADILPYLDKLPADTAEAIRALPWWNIVTPPVAAGAAMVILHRKRNPGNNSTKLALTIAALVALSLNMAFSYFVPLNPKHYARNAAAAIDEFNAGNATLAGLGFMGEEPFTAHMRSKWRMVDKLEELDAIPVTLVLGVDRTEELETYKKTAGAREIRRKRVNYKSHRYIAVELQENKCQEKRKKNTKQ